MCCLEELFLTLFGEIVVTFTDTNALQLREPIIMEAFNMVLESGFLSVAELIGLCVEHSAALIICCRYPILGPTLHIATKERSGRKVASVD